MLKAAALLLALMGMPPELPPVVPTETYTRPAQVVRLPDGRAMNLFCLGSGAPTVILDSGAGQGTSAWSNVQAGIARTTRVCAFDRAGLGFSSPGPMPRDAGAMVDDQEAMLRAAGLTGPFVLVGHSLGGLNAQLYAFRSPEQVAGMVLIDPSVPDWERRVRGVAPTLMAAADQARARRRACADRVIAGGFGPGAAGFEACFPPPPESLPPAVRALVAARQVSADMHRTINSEADAEAASSAQIERHRRQLGDLPLIVLTATGQTYPASIPDEEVSAVRGLWERAHQDIATLSERGELRRVKAGHYIGQTRPDVIVAAVQEVVEAARRASAARPLGSPPARG